MKNEIRYIELKSGFNDDGPAWIAEVAYSQSGQTLYFNDMALKKLKSPGAWGANHFDIETGEEYWVSGIKTNGQDRHWAGGGTIMIDKGIVDQYLKLVGLSALDKSRYELVDINKNFDKSRFHDLENAHGRPVRYQGMPYHRWHWDNNRSKLIKE